MNAPERYADRHEAGRTLARQIPEKFCRTNAMVLALPRGGVPVGFEVANALGVPLDVFVVRKLGAPRQPELAIGAIASGGYEVLNHALIDQLGVTELELAEVADRETNELHRREAQYRGDRPAIDVRERCVILVDDGLATGSTMRAAITAVRDQGVAQLLVAAPVGAADTCEELSALADELVCPLQPEPFHAVGSWYEQFAPTSDHEVRRCLAVRSAHAAYPGHGQ